MRRATPGRKLRQTDWIASATGSAFESFPLGQVDGVNLVDLADMTDHNDCVTVERIVGEYFIRVVNPSADTVIMFFMGIAVRQCDENGAVIFLDPIDDQDADSNDWLWRRHYIIAPLFPVIVDTTGGHVFSTYEEAHLDVHVRRKMRGRDQLVLFTHGVQLQGQAPNPIQSFQLRTLVKLS